MIKLKAMFWTYVKQDKKKLKEDDKRNPNEEPIKYFEMTFQTQNENLRAACFSPEKRERLA